MSPRRLRCFALEGPLERGRLASKKPLIPEACARARRGGRGLLAAGGADGSWRRRAGVVRRAAYLPSEPPLDRRIARTDRCPGQGLPHRPHPVLAWLGCGLRAVPGHRPLGLALHASRRLRKQMFNTAAHPAERPSHACNVFHPSAPCGPPNSHGRSPRTPRGLTPSRHC